MRGLIFMCGIAGIVCFENHSHSKEISLMADVLKHRGPDDEGYLAIDLNNDKIWSLVGDESKPKGIHIDSFTGKANMFLAHRRLSIIDLTIAGHQPMTDIHQEIWIVFNGEIYNYLELKEELNNSGYQFRTNTDTEVILASYEKWGYDCINRFNGMWAFIIYDRRKHILFGSRDRFGVKPLYYYFDKKHFAFASEIKALLRVSFIEKKLNAGVAFDYLALGLEEYEEEGIFKSIYGLKPSHSFELNLKTKSFKKWAYYALKTSTCWEGFDAGRLKVHSEKIKELIIHAIKLRLRSDVPVGTCLSGGIDSSVVACLINELLKKETFPQVSNRQRTFTVGSQYDIIDETKWAKIVVDHTNSSWEKVFPSKEDFFTDLKDLVYTQDIPIGTARTYAQFRVMKLAQKNGIKVLLDGQGADELFSGYPPLYGFFFAEILKNFDFSSLDREIKALGNSPVNFSSVINSMMKIYTAKYIPAPVIKFLLRTFSKKRQCISNDFWKKYSDRLSAMREDQIALNHMLNKYMAEYSLQSLLRREDRNSMRFSIEARNPFSDDIELIEYVFGVPSIYKIHNGWSKYLLRESMKDFLPDEIRNRKDKIGFAAPESYWLSGLKNELRMFITKDLEEFVDVDVLFKEWQRLDSITSVHSVTDTNIWRVINFAVWLNVFNSR